MFLLKSLKTSQINRKILHKILKLKDKTWKFGLRSQKIYFNKNIKKNDIHNLLFLKSELIGYTLLKKINFLNKKKKQRILYLDTMVIKKEYRKKKIASLLMNFNNQIIVNYGYFCVLSCDRKLVKFYKKFKWSQINLKKTNLQKIKPNLIKMCINKKNG